MSLTNDPSEETIHPSIKHRESEDNDNVGHVKASSPATPLFGSNELSPKLNSQDSVNLDVPFLEQFKPERYSDSREAARELFRLLVSPVGIKRFYE